MFPQSCSMLAPSLEDQDSGNRVEEQKKRYLLHGEVKGTTVSV